MGETALTKTTFLLKKGKCYCRAVGLVYFDDTAAMLVDVNKRFLVRFHCQLYKHCLSHLNLRRLIGRYTLNTWA